MKENLQAIVHFDLPHSVKAYYDDVSTIGRKITSECKCYLFFGHQDVLDGYKSIIRNKSSETFTLDYGIIVRYGMEFGDRDFNRAFICHYAVKGAGAEKFKGTNASVQIEHDVLRLVKKVFVSIAEPKEGEPQHPPFQFSKMAEA
jgi:hypothetical protein